MMTHLRLAVLAASLLLVGCASSPGPSDAQTAGYYEEPVVVTPTDVDQSPSPNWGRLGHDDIYYQTP